MLKPKKKLTKRELKQDKFILYTLKAREYAEEHARTLMYAGIGILVLILIVTLYINSRRSAAEHANQLYGEALFEYNRMNQSKAKEMLKQLLEEYSGTKYAGQGCFLLAKIYWQNDQYDSAKIYFRQYIDDYADDKLLTAAALAGYGDCLLSEGNTAEAAVYYERAAKVDTDNPLAASYFYSAARAYFETGNKDKARTLAQRVVDDYDRSVYKGKAEVLLNMIKLKT